MLPQRVRAVRPVVIAEGDAPHSVGDQVDAHAADREGDRRRPHLVGDVLNDPATAGVCAVAVVVVDMRVEPDTWFASGTISAVAWWYQIIVAASRPQSVDVALSAPRVARPRDRRVELELGASNRVRQRSVEALDIRPANTVEVLLLVLGELGRKFLDRLERRGDVAPLHRVASPRVLENRSQINLGLLRDLLQYAAMGSRALGRDATAKLDQLGRRLERATRETAELGDRLAVFATASLLSALLWPFHQINLR